MKSLAKPGASFSLCLCVLLGACSAQLSGSENEPNRAGPGAQDGTGLMPTPGSMPPPNASTGGPVVTVPPPAAIADCSGQQDPGFVGLRRLTRTEYDLTVRDLLGEQGQPAKAFPNDDSVLAANSVVSSLFLEKHEAVVDRMVEDAWSRELSGQQPASAQLLNCDLAAGMACAQSIVQEFANRAWRRPATASELEPFVRLINLAVSQGDELAVGVKLALKGLLTAPDFLFRVELDSGAAPRALSPHELAVRLSYLLWSSTPDTQLRQLADQARLSDPASIASEMTRMLADPKASAFSSGFSNHWLGLGALGASQPEPALSGGFDEALRTAMTNETIEVFRGFVNSGLNFRDILDTNFTFLNQRLADHYGLALPALGVSPEILRQVSLDSGPRRGLLAQGSILTMTSGPTSTSPVKRGKFVLSHLLCSSPPPPPPGADQLTMEAHEAKSERERLQIHRANPACASCHVVMDPIGLGLENFDFVGRYRTAYADGGVIDPSGDLPGGITFGSFEELRAILKDDPRVLSCVSQKLFTYAIGREPTSTDQCVMNGVTKHFSETGRFADLLSTLAGSPAFTQRRPEGDTQ